MRGCRVNLAHPQRPAAFGESAVVVLHAPQFAGAPAPVADHGPSARERSVGAGYVHLPSGLRKPTQRAPVERRPNQ